MSPSPPSNWSSRVGVTRDWVSPVPTVASPPPTELHTSREPTRTPDRTEGRLGKGLDPTASGRTPRPTTPGTRTRTTQGPEPRWRGRRRSIPGTPVGTWSARNDPLSFPRSPGRPTRSETCVLPTVRGVSSPRPPPKGPMSELTCVPTFSDDLTPRGSGRTVTGMTPQVRTSTPSRLRSSTTLPQWTTRSGSLLTRETSDPLLGRDRGEFKERMKHRPSTHCRKPEFVHHHHHHPQPPGGLV